MSSERSNRIIAVAFTTLDGVVEDPDGSWGTASGGWARHQGPPDVAGDNFRLTPVLQDGALLLGRQTWQLFAARWPSRTGEFADTMNRAPKYVASRTIGAVDGWSGSTLLDGELTAAVEQLRAERDVVVVGSTSIVEQLAARRLIDEYRFVVVPVVVGAGRRLFEGAEQPTLCVTDAEVVGGSVLLRYDVDRGRSC
jgi:dihydrofolate reductase